MELMATVTIAAILFGLSIPAFRSMINGNKLRTAATDFAAALNIARSEAITRNTPVTFCRVATETGTACVTSAGVWTNWVIRNPAGVIRRGTVTTGGISVSSTLATDQLTFSPDGLTRNATGVVVSGGTITVCTSNLSTDNRRVLTLGSASRVSVDKTTGTCP